MAVDSQVLVPRHQWVHPDPLSGFGRPFQAPARATTEVDDPLASEERTVELEVLRVGPLVVVVGHRDILQHAVLQHALRGGALAPESDLLGALGR